MILTRHDGNVQSTSTNIYGFEFVRVCEGIRGGNCKLSTARLRKMMDRGRLNGCFFTFRTRTLLRMLYRICRFTELLFIKLLSVIHDR